MISAHYVQTMARYNAWQNGQVIAAADTLDAAALREDRGAFFGSIMGTLNHVLWADTIWMHRLAGWPKPEGGIPESPALHDDWAALKAGARKGRCGHPRLGGAGPMPRFRRISRGIPALPGATWCGPWRCAWRICSTTRRITAGRSTPC